MICIPFSRNVLLHFSQPPFTYQVQQIYYIQRFDMRAQSLFSGKSCRKLKKESLYCHKQKYQVQMLQEIQKIYLFYFKICEYNLISWMYFLKYQELNYAKKCIYLCKQVGRVQTSRVLMTRSKYNFTYRLTCKL